MKAFLFFPLLMVVYLLVMYFKYGMTISISATAKKHTSTLETVFFSLTLLVGIVFPFAALGFEASEGSNFQFVWLFASAFIGLIHAAQAYWKNRQIYLVHMAGSYVGIIAGMLAVLLTIHSVFSIVVVSLFALFAVSQMIPLKFIEKLKVPNHIYWVEVSAIFSVWLVLLVNYKNA